MRITGSLTPRVPAEQEIFKDLSDEQLADACEYLNDKKAFRILFRYGPVVVTVEIIHCDKPFEVDYTGSIVIPKDTPPHGIEVTHRIWRRWLEFNIPNLCRYWKQASTAKSDGSVAFN